MVSLHIPQLCLSFYLLPNVFQLGTLFISAQIFQIPFKGMNWIDLNWNPSQERGSSEPFVTVQNILPRDFSAIMSKNNCYFRHPFSPWRASQSKSRFFRFFLDLLFKPHHTKISVDWGPLRAFPNVWRNIYKLCSLNICWDCLGHKVKGNFIFTIIFFQWEMRSFTFELLFGKKHRNDTLNLLWHDWVAISLTCCQMSRRRQYL